MDLHRCSRTERYASYGESAERMVVEKNFERRIVRTGRLPEIELQSSLESIIQETRVRRDIQRDHSRSAFARPHPHVGIFP